MPALHGLAAGERQGSKSAPVEAIVEGYEILPPRVIAREFHRGLDRFRPRVSEKDLLGKCPRGDLAQLLGQFHHIRDIEIRARYVDQPRRLFVNDTHNLRMTVPRGANGDSSGKIEKNISVHVLHHRSISAVHYQRIASRVGG